MPNDKFVPIPMSILDEAPGPTVVTTVNDDGSVNGYETPPGQPGVLQTKPPKPSLLSRAGDVAIEGGKAVFTGVKDALNMQVFKAVGSLSGSYAVPEDDMADLAPTTGPGRMLADVTKFFSGMVGSGLLLKGAGLLQGTGKLVSTARGMTAGAITGAMVMDPHAERLSNLVQEYPILANPVTEFMAAKPDDSEAVGRLKNALEDILTGGVLESFIAGASAVRRGIAAGKVSGAAAKELAAVADEIQTIQSSGRVVNLKPLPGKEAEFKAAQEYAQPVMSDDLKKYILEDLKNDIEGTSLVQGRDFNFDKLDSEDAVKQALNLVSDAIAPEIDKLKGGVQTFKETSELADILGLDSAQLMVNIAQDARTVSAQAARVVQGKRLLQSLGRQISKEASLVDLGTAVPEKLSKLIDTMGHLQGHLKATITGAARTTSAGRIRTFASFAPEEVRLFVAAGGDPKAIGRLLEAKSLWGKIIGVHNQYWINALLSSPLTHVKNTVGGIYNTIMQPTNRLIGGVVSGDFASAREAASTFVGLWRHRTEALKMAAKAFRTSTPTLTHNASKTEGLAGASGSLTGWLGNKINLATRFLMAEDEFFQQLNYRANLYSKFTRQGMDSGLEGVDLAQSVQSSVDNAFLPNGTANIDNMITHESKRQAARSTFTEDLRPDSWGADIVQLVNKHPEARLFAPFVRTPYNILRRGLQDSGPMGIFSKTVREDFAAGGARKAEAIGRMLTGAAISTSAAGLALSGNITGAAPKNPDGSRAIMPKGWQPYSLKLEDTYVSYQGLEPLSTMLGTITDMVQISEQISEDERNSLGGTIVAGITSNLSNKAYLQGVVTMIDVLDSGDPRLVDAWLRRQAASYVPALVNQAAKTVDPLTRQAWDIKEQFLTRIPRLSASVPPQRDYLGQTVERSRGIFMINPFSLSTSVPGHVSEELSRLSKREGGFQLPPRNLDGVQLSHEQYDKMMELRGSLKLGGKNLEERLSELVASPEYQKRGDSIGILKSGKREWVDRITAQYQNHAEQKLTLSTPGLKEARLQARLNKKAALHNRADLVKPEANQGTDALLRLINPQQ